MSAPWDAMRGTALQQPPLDSGEDRLRWVLVGFDAILPDGQPGVAIMASNVLTEAKLESIVKDPEALRLGLPRDPGDKGWIHTVKVVMDDYVIIVARDWATAFTGIQEHWSPDGPANAAGPAALPRAGQPADPQRRPL